MPCLGLQYSVIADQYRISVLQTLLVRGPWVPVPAEGPRASHYPTLILLCNYLIPTICKAGDNVCKVLTLCPAHSRNLVSLSSLPVPLS